ncbi:Metal tolerance protein 5 [Escovopsis weberi]|uniref:Metal tolerance protein 5 n=1 Tax=Escovopsis weberi TaxID=150374 RepID=A0A0M8N4K9_ESCWE|nr:Metal tolerance protein 5 [Escovopsis weberi]
MKLIGRSNPRYRWELYWKTEEELNQMARPIEYYERTNSLIQQYLYIDCLLDSSIPHDLLNEYGNELEASAFRPLAVPTTISEESSQRSPSQSQPQTPMTSYRSFVNPESSGTEDPSAAVASKTMAMPQRRTPKDIFRSSENMPLLLHASDHEQEDDRISLSEVMSKTMGPRPWLPWLENADIDSDSPIVTLAIWINLVANVVLLAGKIAVIASRDQYSYPIGRSRLEPLGVLVFSVIIVTSFFQVSLECIERLSNPEHKILQLGTPALAIMISTIMVKGLCWLWTRLVRNSSVRALADDAKTDVIFNIGSIFFPIVGYYGQIWWLDPLGGLLLSIFVIYIWSRISIQHIRNLTGVSARPDERNLLLYLTMRFATAIRQIQNLRAYHAGDKLVVEVDIVLSAITPLKDSHDLSEVLTYFLESVPIVDRAFVHVDYMSYNAPTHMLKGEVRR